MVFGSGMSHHGFIVTEDSKLYGFGRNSTGELGVGDSTKNRNKLSEIKFFSKKIIRKISCGEQHSLFITENNEVFSTGLNSAGQLGVNDVDERNTPTRVVLFPFFEDHSLAKQQYEEIIVIDIFAGSYHSLVLSNLLDVYSFGRNSDGQLGIGDSRDRKTMTRAILSEKIISVSCGSYYSCFISINGGVFTCGYNSSGQCGNKYSKLSNTITGTPMRVLSNEKKIIQVACGWDFTFFVTDDNRVYVTGYNDKGQLGLGNASKFTNKTPVIVESLKDEKVNFVKCGAKYTLFQCKNKIMLCGDNQYGQQGNGEILVQFNNVSSPKLFSIEGKKIIQSLPIRRSSLYFTKNEVFGCGQNDEGQLFCGKGKMKNPKIFKICNLKVKKRKLHCKNEKQKEKLERYEFLLLCVKDDTNIFV